MGTVLREPNEREAKILLKNKLSPSNWYVIESYKKYFIVVSKRSYMRREFNYD